MLKTLQPSYHVPNYIKEFQCIGSDCEDTCCSLWEISIDKETYKKYQNIQDPQLKALLSQNMELNDRGSSYASFMMDQNTGNCPMLCDGWCSIQSKLGEGYLSQTCSTYPRVLNQVGNATEISALLSCPEISRALLLSPEAMEFDHTFIPSTPNLNIVTVNLREHNQYAIDQVRGLAYEIIGDNRFSFQHRLIMLGVFFDNADDFLKTKEYAKLPVFIDEFRLEVEHNAELRDYDAFPQNDPFQFEYVHNMLMSHLKDFIWNKRYTECVNSYVRGIQINGSLLQECISTYLECKGTYFDQYLIDHPHVMENYIKNYIYQSMGSAILSGETFFDFYTKMVIDYSLIKLHLVGMSSEKKGLRDDHVVKLIQSYTKNYKFSNKFSSTIHNKVKSDGYQALGYLSLLIK